MEPIESVRRPRGMLNPARAAGLLIALSVSLAGCVGTGASEKAVHGDATPTAEGRARNGTGIEGRVTADEATRFAKVATKRIRGADVYQADMLRNVAIKVCRLVDSGLPLRFTGTVEVLGNYEIADQHVGLIASLAVHTACPEVSADTFPAQLWAPTATQDSGGKGPNHGPALAPAMLNENKYVGRDAKDVRRELEAKGYTVRVEQGRFAHMGRVTWLEQSKTDRQSVVLILSWCGPADEGCPKRSRLSKDAPHGYIRCRSLPVPGVLMPTFYSRWTLPKGGAARCVTIPRKANSDLIVFLRPRGQAVVVDASEPKSSALYVNRFSTPVLHGLRTVPISLRGWHTLMIGRHSIDRSGWD